jgi:SAM-dependent methyltransferase
VSPTAGASAPPRSSTLEFFHACPICGAARLREYCRVPSLFTRDDFIRYDRCLGCGVVFRNPRLPVSDRLDRYRQREATARVPETPPHTHAHYRYVAHRLRTLLPAAAGRRLFDFGCGAGGFLAAALEAGFEPFGLELNRALAREVSERLGVGVHSGLVSDPDFPQSTFDVITSFEVFEHLTDPRGTLGDLARHLAPHGLLLIEVPNLHDARERWRRGSTMDDSHLFYFDRGSLSHLLTTAGFTIVEVSEGLRPYRLLGPGAARLPAPLYRALERTTAALQLKTALAVVATPGSIR